MVTNGSTREQLVGFLSRNLDGYNKPYVANTSIHLWDAIAGTDEQGRECLGLNTYLSWHCSTSRRFDWTYYNWVSMESTLKEGKPFIQHVEYSGAMPDIGLNQTHAVVAVGFRQVTSAQKMLIINDGWGNNKREVEIRGGTMPIWMSLA